MLNCLDRGSYPSATSTSIGRWLSSNKLLLDRLPVQLVAQPLSYRRLCSQIQLRLGS